MSAEFTLDPNDPTGNRIYMFTNDEGTSRATNEWVINNVKSIQETSVDLGTLTPPSGILDFAITQQPADQLVLPGATALFTVGVTPAAGISYQWLRNGSPIPGATQTTYTTPVAALSDIGTEYSCMVWDASGSSTTVAATLGLWNIPPVEFTTVDYTANVGDSSVTLTVEQFASDGSARDPVGPLTVDYYTIDGSAIAGRDYQAASGTIQLPNNNADSISTFTIHLMSKPTGGTFTVQLRNPVNLWLTTYITASITIPPDPSHPQLQITQNPQDQLVNVGQTATFAIQTTPGIPITNYQWFKNGVPVLNNNHPSYITPSVTAGDNNSVVACVVNNGQLLLESAPATLTITGGTSSTNAITPAMRVFPNPWRADQHTGLSMTFDQMPPNSTVKIFTVSGHWVKTLEAPSGAVAWDLKTDNGDKAASGLYLYLVTDSSGNTFKGKFAIIR